MTESGLRIPRTEQAYPTLLNELPDNLEINRIPPPVTAFQAEGKTVSFKIHTNKLKYREQTLEANDPQLLNLYLPQIKQLARNHRNFTIYKAQLWQEKMGLPPAIAYNIALLVPDIYRPALTDLRFKEHPHLGFYTYGPAGGLRTTIGRLLEKQWLYSVYLSEVGFDSDVGVLYMLSRINRDTLFIASDIGSATQSLKDWQRKLPAMVVNFLWDGRETRVTKSEGSLEAINQGVSGFMGGNRPLSGSPFSIKDVSRIIQRQMPLHKGRPVEMLIDRVRGRTRLDELVHPQILYYHYLTALIVKGRVNSGIFDEKEVVIDIDDLKPKILGFIFRHYIPEIVKDMSNEDIYSRETGIIEAAKDVEEDTNAILRILPMSYMLIMDSVIDNLLNRPYEVRQNKIIVKALEEDMGPWRIIMDEYFWEEKKREYKMAPPYMEIKPDHFIPKNCYYNILKETRQMMTATQLYATAYQKLVGEEIMSESQFRSIYGGTSDYANNAKLQRHLRELTEQSDIVRIEGRPLKWIYHAGD